MAKRPELDRNTLAHFVFGSLQLRGDGKDDFLGRARRSTEWYKKLIGRGASGLLFSLVHDVGYLILDGDQFAFRSLSNFEEIPEKARDVRLTYENAFLNSLLRDPLMIRARNTIMQDKSRDDLIARTIQCILAPLVVPRKPGFSKAPRLNLQLLRELSLYGGMKPEKHYEDFIEHCEEEDFFERALRESMEKLLSREYYLDERDLAEIEHWDAYQGREDLRKIGRRIAFHSTRIHPADRRRFTLVEEEPEVDSELADAGTYPQGGFSELSTRGTPENLVPSELIYLGEGNIFDMSAEELEIARQAHDGEGTPTIIDLFAFRFVTKEILYYMRESGTLKRVRRTVHFVLEPDPPLPPWVEDYQGLRMREPGLEHIQDRPILIMLGLAVRLAQDLGLIFSKDSVRFEIHILARNVEKRAEAERDAQILRVLLEHEISHDKVGVNVVTQFDMRECLEKHRRVYGISVQYKDLEAPGLHGSEPVPKQLRGTILRLGGTTPDCTLKGVETVPLSLNNELLDTIVRARDALLSTITGSRGRR